MKKHSSIFFKIASLTVLLTSMLGAAYAQTPPDEGTHNVTVATGCGSYTWDANGETYHTSGVYTYAYDNAMGYASVDTLKLTINPVPNVEVDGNDTVCFGVISGLKATGATTYWWWHTGNGMAEPVNSVPKDSITVTLTEIDTFIVVGTNSYGCHATDTFPVLVLPLPSVVAHAHTSRICRGYSVTLTASGAHDYVWRPGNLFGQPVEAWPKRTTTYTVTGYDFFGCKNTASVTVEVEGVDITADKTKMCDGDTATFTASGAFSYSWILDDGSITADDNITSEIYKATKPGTYIVTGTAHGVGCTTKDTVTLTVYDLPEVRIMGPEVINGTDTICKGDTAMLVANGAHLYSWKIDADIVHADTVMAFPTVNKKYLLQGEDTLTRCKAKDSVLVVVHALPEVKITGPTVVNGRDTICKGDTTMLVGEGAKYYSWSESYIWTNSMETKDSIKISPVANISYIVTGTDTNKCKAKDTVDVVVNALPEVRITGPNVVNGQDTICKGDTTMLVGEGAKYYTWNEPYIWTSSVETKDSIKISPKENIKYIVTGTDTNKCKAKDTVNIVVHALPEVRITGPDVVDGQDTICKGDTTMLVGEGAKYYSWDKSYIWTSSVDTKDSIKISPKVDVKYIVTGTDTNKCKAKDTVNVVVLALPEVKITGPDVVNGQDTICKGDTTLLIGEGAKYYSWNKSYIWTSSVETKDSIKISPVANVKYIVTGTDTNKCKAKDTVNVVVNTLPEVSITGPTVVNGRDTLCAGDTSMYIATGAKFYDWVEVNRGESYIWTSSVERKDTILISPPGSTLKYVVTGTDTNKCKSKDTVDVIVYPNPHVSIDGDDEVCKGKELLLGTATGSHDWPIEEYEWNTGDDESQITVSPTEDTEYKVKVTDEHGCTATSTKSVTVHSLPSFQINSNKDAICPGQTVTLTASGAESYEWSTGQTTASITVNSAGTYTVTGTDEHGCTATASKTLNLRTLPTVVIGGSDKLCPGDNLTLTASGAQDYQWSNGQTSAAIVVDVAGIYSVTGTDSYGCSATVTKSVSLGTRPVISVTGDDVVCAGNSVTLTAANVVGSCVWKNLTGAVVGTNPQLQITPTESNQYTVIGDVSGNNCQGVGVKYVRVNPTPEIGILADSLVCEGEPMTLIATARYAFGAVSYIWYPGGSTGASLTVTQTESEKIYTVRGTTDHGCQATHSKTVRIRPPAGHTQRITACGDKYTWRGQVFFDSGTYVSPYPTTDEHGCQSYDTLQLTLDYNAGSVETISESEYYHWNKTDETYYHSGTYASAEFLSENGCPTADTLHLTIINDEVFDVPCVIYGFMVRAESCDPGEDGVLKLSIPEEAREDCEIKWTLKNGATSSDDVVEGLSEGIYHVKVTSRTCPDVIYFEDDVELEGCVNDLEVTITGPEYVKATCSGMPEVTYTINVRGGRPPYTFPDGSRTFRYTPPIGHFTISRTVTDADGNSATGILEGYAKTQECAVDPNEITGPTGYSEEKRFVNATDKMNYIIEFENDPDFATAPASRVKVTYDIPVNQDFATFRLSDFGFGSFVFTVPSNVTSYYQRLDVSDSLGVWVDVTAGLDIQNNKLFWIFQSIDPATGAEPVNSQMGFLAINDSLGHGEGYVSYYISPKNTVATGDTVAAKALIVFDENESIGTNVWTNTFDVVAPSSTLIAEMNEQDSLYCTFSFDAEDDANGSGVKEVELFMSVNNATYQSLGRTHPDSSLSYALENGMYYQFMSIATDNVGNKEAFKAQPDTVVNYNTAPMDLMLTGNTFYEYDTLNTFIGTFSTVDDDMSQPFVYTLVNGEGGDDNDLFTIEGNSLRTNANFVCSSDLNYYVRVRTTDFGGMYFEKSFRVKEIRQHITPTVNILKTICEGESYDFHGTELTTAGSYSSTLQTSEGCDSIVILFLTVNPSYDITLDTLVCDEFVWNDSIYTESDTISYTYTLATGCDSTVTYNLTVNYSTEGVDEQVACDSFTWINDSTYTVSTNTPTVTLTNAVGCDSVVTLHLTVNYSTEGIDEQVACDSYTWINDITYTESTNTPTVTLTNAAGCDSVVTLHLTINQSTEGIDDQIACDSFTWINDSTYTESTNTPTVTLTNAAGCDSVVTLHLTLNYSYEVTDERTVCDNELPILWNGVEFTAAGTQTATLSTVNDCDSVVTMTLYVNPTYNVTDERTVCDNELPVLWNNVEFTAAGTQTATLSTVNDCDSVVTMTLYVNPTYNVTDERTVCDNELPILWNNVEFTAAGTQTATLSTINDCDSVVTMTLHVNPTYNVTDEYTVCDNELPIIWNGVEFTAAGTQTATLSTINNCDSVVTMTLTVNPIYQVADTQTICVNQLPYTWNEVEFTQAGTQTTTLQSVNGCDSVVTMTLTVVNSLEGTDAQTICASELPYTWNGVEFTQAGTQTVSLQTVNGCDSVVTMTLHVNPIYNVTDGRTVCDNELPIIWNGIEFTAAGTQTATLSTINDCDSVVTMTLHVNPTYNVSDERTVCDNELPLVWNGIQFTAAGTQTATLSTVNGCDSVVTMTLHVNPTYNVTDERTVCDNELPILWNGIQFTAAGTQTATLNTFNDCDSVVTMTLHVNPTYNVTDELTICDNELPIIWNGVQFTAAGTRTATLSTVNDCDSVVTMTLHVNPTYNVTDERTVCDNELPLVWNGVEFTTAGTQTATLSTVNDCDSVVTMTLTVNQPTAGIDEQVSCDSFTWMDDSTYTESTTMPTFTIVGGAANGCDSIVTLHLVVNHSYTVTDAQTICANELPYTWNGVVFTEAGTQTATLSTVNGCDSVVTMTLTVNQPATGIDEQEACGSYTWVDGVTYTASTTTPTFTIMGGASNGCDSTVTLHLTINQPATGVDEQMACESFTWINGITYAESTTTPTYTYVGGAANGCDSTVTLHLTINQPATGVDEQVACDSYTWIDGVTYTASTSTPTYTYVGGAANGCDSTVTLHLTINQPTTGVDEQVACESFTWINGITYTESTTTPTYTYVGGATNGCDSTVTLHLTINHSTTAVDVQEACDSLLWIDGVTYYESTSDANTPTFIMTNAAGCDSVITLNLSLNHSVTVDYYLTISDDDLPFTYGDTTFMPGTVQSGDYTVVMETADGCDSVITLHLTVTDIKDYLMNVAMNVYPNPTNGKINVQLSMNNVLLSPNAEIQLYDMYGKWLKTWKATGETTVIDLSSYAASVYFIKAVDGQRMIGIRKVVKE